MADLIQVVDAVTPELRRLASIFPAAADRALIPVGRLVQNMAVRQANRIERAPIPTRAQINAYNRHGGRPRRVGGSGVKAWVRTGGLVRAIQAGLESASGQVTLTADTPYALARHQLGVTASVIGGRAGWVPRRPALGIVRLNPFFQEATDMTAPQVLPVYEAALRRELGI